MSECVVETSTLRPRPRGLPSHQKATVRDSRTNHEAPITSSLGLQLSAYKQHFTQIVHVYSQTVAARQPSNRELSTAVMRPSVRHFLLYIRCLRKDARFCKRLLAYLVSSCRYCQLQEIKDLRHRVVCCGLMVLNCVKLGRLVQKWDWLKRHTMA